MKSRFAKGCFLVVLLLVVSGGYLFWRAKTPPAVGEDFKTLSPAEQQQRREEARQTENNVQEVIRKIKSGDKSPFRLAASEQVLNTLLQDRINTDKFPIHNLRVGMESGQLSLQGTLPYKGMDTTATLTGSVAAKNGKIAYNVDSLLLGGLFQAPRKWKQKAENEVEKNLNKLIDSQNITITNATIANKELVIEGVPR